MNKKNQNIQKRTYCTPSVECVKLDNEISLVLESASPPAAPGFEGGIVSKAPEHFNNDPFKTNLG